MAKSLLNEDGEVIALINPNLKQVRKRLVKGIVRDKSTHYEVIETIVEFCKNWDLESKAYHFHPLLELLEI